MAVSRKAATKNLKIQRMAYGTYKVHTTEWQFKAIISGVCERCVSSIIAINCSRGERGQSETRVHLKSLEQKIDVQ